MELFVRQSFAKYSASFIYVHNVACLQHVDIIGILI